MKSLMLTLALVASASMARGISSFELPQMNHASPGTAYKSSDHPNSVFVIENYFNSCSPCNMNAGNVDRLASDYALRDVQVVDVGTDRRDSDYAAWIGKHHPNHPVLKDADQILTLQLGTGAFPSTYVVDCQGNVLVKTVGTWDASSRRRIDQAIEAGLDRCSP